MATITKFLFLRHLTAGPTTHVRHTKNGALVHEGVGSAFWFRPLTAALSEVPIDDREQPLLFHARTLDFQQATVQASVTYRVTDPATAAGRIDFAVDAETGNWTSTPLEQIGGLLTELAQQHTLELIASMPLADALANGVAAVRERVAHGLGGDERLAAMGVQVVDVRVVAVRADADVERALQTPAREQIQQDADKATFERRALAVERERAIAENEMQNQIELARRQEQLVEQEGQNERRRAAERVAAERIQAEATALNRRLEAETGADTKRLLSTAEADATRELGEAEGAAETARLAAYQQLEAATILALAVKELAGSLPNIGTLNVTPDLLTSFLAGLTGRQEVAA